MGDLPSGIVTFFFSDIEGSTRMVQRLGPAYDEVLAAHHHLLTKAIETKDGAVVSSSGDSLFAVFTTASAAVQAAIHGQRALATHPWPPGGVIKVRIGLHTGVGTRWNNTYTGIDVHRAARISDAGHGGQVLASGHTTELADQENGLGVTFRDLGAYRLKDLPDPERLYQVETPDLPSDFPPLRSLEARPHNLPAQLTEFVGRAGEIADVSQALERARLITILGPGGIGKTRLAIAVASKQLPRFEDGVVFVDLAELKDPTLVPAAVAAAVGLTESGDVDLVRALNDYLMPRRLLLVLDNLEQVLGAGSWLAEMLGAAPNVRALTTSRVVLRVGGEHVYELAPLALPGGLEETQADTESVELFVRRARAADPQFELSPENLRAVNEIVRRLEGWPLAIELAAARVRVLLPPVLASRLEAGISELGSGVVDLPQRHRTIRETIAWSYELLDPITQVMLARLGVFAGGFTLEAGEAVGAGVPVTNPLEALASLLDASLLRRRVDHGSVRFSFLTPVREFAIDRLRDSGEEPELLRRHAQHFLELAEAQEPRLSRGDQVASIDQLSADHDNIRAVLRFSANALEPDLGLRVGGALWRFWHASGHLAEGRSWLEDLLELTGASDASRAKGLSGLAGLAYWQGDYLTARHSYEEAVGIYRRLGDRLGEAHALFGLSTTLIWLDDDAGGSLLVDQARQLYEELGERSEVRNILMASGFAGWKQGDLAGARRLWEESMEIAREVGDDAEAAINQLALASLSFLEGNHGGALTEAGKGLEELVALKNSAGTVMALDWIAALAGSLTPRDACRLAGAAEKLRARQGGGMRPESVGLTPARDSATSQIGERDVAVAHEEGSALDLAEAVTLARSLLAEARKIAVGEKITS